MTGKSDSNFFLDLKTAKLKSLELHISCVDRVLGSLNYPHREGHRIISVKLL